MPIARTVVLLVAVALLVALPLVLRSGEAAAPDAPRSLIIVTPHNEQIRSEFGPAFERWHEARHGERVNVIFSVPGGTSEIRRMLEAQVEAAVRAGRPPGGNADLVFGGGSYEHARLKRGVIVDGERVPISAPVTEFTDAWLEEVYGENRIGDLPLYDPDRHWFGTALSGFGIVYNRDVLGDLGLDEPTSWGDLCDPRLRGWVALVNPAQSGSVTTAFDAILQRRGWIEGWRILRRAAANSRYFSASSLKPPIDVSRGDAAMGVSIDFYGRYQAQAVRNDDGSSRVGYVDPAGETLIDPDPISLLAGAPNRESAVRFIEFTLSEAGQSLWQFRADGGIDELGPRRFELRRMPARRSMYARWLDRFVDRVDPFEIARPLEEEHAHYRAFIAVVFAAMAMDIHEPLREAWSAIVEHPAYPRTAAIVTADDVDDPALAAMLRDFDALPPVPGPGGAELRLDVEADLPEIKRLWLDGEGAAQGLHAPQDTPEDALRRRLVAAFLARYRRVVETAATAGADA